MCTRLEEILDECDQALRERPVLSTVFSKGWRNQIREKTLAEQKLLLPPVYASPYFEESFLDVYFHEGYQLRLEEGASILQPRCTTADWNHIARRLREGNSHSAEEELLLARGFGTVFGVDAIRPCPIGSNDTSPEFRVAHGSAEFSVEATGLQESAAVNDRNQVMLETGFPWVAFGSSDYDLMRARSSVARKILSKKIEGPFLLCFTQYSAWVPVDAAAQIFHTMVTTPSSFKLPPEHAPLAIIYVFMRTLQGMWFSSEARRRFKIDDDLVDRIRQAVFEAFWQRPDGKFEWHAG